MAISVHLFPLEYTSTLQMVVNVAGIVGSSLTFIWAAFTVRGIMRVRTVNSGDVMLLLAMLLNASFGGWFVPFGSMAALGYLIGFHIKQRRRTSLPTAGV